MTERLKQHALSMALATAMVSAILYNYNVHFVGFLTLLSFLGQIMCYEFFEKVRRMGKQGGFLYIGALILVIIMSFILLIGSGIGLASEKMNIPYMLLLLVGCTFFMGSVVFYFTHVIYRSVFLFLLMLIPITLQVGRYSNIHFMYVILILGLYIALRIQRRSLADGTIVQIENKRAFRKNNLIFLFVVMLLAVVLPKPNVSLIDLGAGPSKYLESFKSSTENEGAAGKGKVLYKVDASEPLYLRRQTFDSYVQDHWEPSDLYGGTGSKTWAKNKENHDYSGYLKVLRYYANQNIDFKEMFKLSELPEPSYNIRSAQITLADIRSNVILTSNNVISISNLSTVTDLYGTLGNDVFIRKDMILNEDDSYIVRYFSEAAQLNAQSIPFVQRFNRETYEDLNSAVMKLCVGDYDNLDMNQFQSILRSFTAAEAEALQYQMVTYQTPSDRVKNLANQITQGLLSDYDKAKALEAYFQNNGYVYDLNYRPSKGQENVEDFLFVNKRGRCTDYATAMTLLARSVNLPARYVEGYLVTEKENATTYIVKDTDAHAFSEVFISGYGWMTFDATVSNSEGQSNDLWESLKNQQNLFFVGLITLVFFTLTAFVYQPIQEAVFRIHVKSMPRERAVVALYKRLKKRASKKLGISLDTLTANMIQYKIKQAYLVDLEELTVAFEKVCYGEKRIEAEEITKAYAIYLEFYQATKGKMKALD